MLQLKIKIMFYFIFFALRCPLVGTIKSMAKVMASQKLWHIKAGNIKYNGAAYLD